MAASTLLRLQTIVSREISPLDSAVLTVGALQAGSKENIIPDQATLKLNMRTYDEHVREHMLSAIQRICCSEAAASGAPQPPDFLELSRYPLTENDAEAAARVAEAFRAEFGDAASEAQRASASEDFSEFGRAWKVPYVFWFVGGTDPATYNKARAEGSVRKIPSNNSPRFAPVLEPTFEVGARAMLAAASVWLCKPAQEIYSGS